MDEKFMSPEPMKNLVEYVEGCVKHQKMIFVFEKKYLMPPEDAAESALELYTLPKEVQMTEVRIFDQEPKVDDYGHTLLSEARAHSHGKSVPLIEKMSDPVRDIQVKLISEEKKDSFLRKDTIRIYQLTPKIK